MRLCVPSYQIPGTWLENLRALRGREWIEGVELLFFAYDADARAILGRELEGIAALSGRFSLSLHLPDPLGPGDEELVASTRGFVGLYVLHPPRASASGPASLESWRALVDAWRSRYGDDFLLEYTGAYDFAAADSVLPGLPLCADSGRLVRDGLSPARWMAERAGRVRELHLHGVAGGADHVALSGNEAWMGELAPLLRGFAGRVVLELFSLAQSEASRSVLGKALAS